jgi:hypothetical protein
MVVATTCSYRSICNGASFPFSYKLKDECCGGFFTHLADEFFTHLGVTLQIWNHGVPSIDELLRHFYALNHIYVVCLAMHGKRLDHMF